MNKNHERIFDDYLKLASDEYLNKIEEENDQLMSKYKDVEYPKNLDDWFYEQIELKERKSKRIKRKKMFFSTARRSAAVIAIIIIVGMGVTLSVDAFRIEFFNLFIERTDEYNQYSLTSDDLQKYIDEDNLKYYPRYVPNDFKLIEYNHNVFETNMKFMNGSIYFSVNINGENTDIRLDNENAVKSEVTVNGTPATFIQYPDSSSIIIKTDNVIIIVTGNMEKDELLKIAENLF